MSNEDTVLVTSSAHYDMLQAQLKGCQEERARLREALVALVVSGEWLAFGNDSDEMEPMPIADALNLAHATLDRVKP